MAWLQMAGLGLSMLSAYSGGKSEQDRIDALNEAKLAQFMDNKAIVAEMLGTLGERTDRAEDEAVRQSIRTKLSIRKAQIQAEGAATVSAATIGGGSGKRASLALVKPAARVAGDMITDANINLQTELTSITVHFNDTATKAIANLNNSRPIMGTGPSTSEMLIGTAAAGLNAWNSLSTESQTEVKGAFKFDVKPVDIEQPNLLK